MIAELTTWWRGRSPREQILLAVMAALFALVVLVFAIVLPLQDGLAAGRERLDRATLASGQVAARVAALEAGRRAPAPAGGPLAAIVTAAANDAGFTLERANPQGDDRIAIAIPAAKSTVLFAWLAGLEARGIFVETIDIRRNPDASLGVEAMLRQRLP